MIRSLLDGVCRRLMRCFCGFDNYVWFCTYCVVYYFYGIDVIATCCNAIFVFVLATLVILLFAVLLPWVCTWVAFYKVLALNMFKFVGYKLPLLSFYCNWFVVFSFTMLFVMLLSLFTAYLFLLLLLLLFTLLFILLLMGILVLEYSDLSLSTYYSEEDGIGDGRIDTCRWGMADKDNNWALGALWFEFTALLVLLILLLFYVTCSFTIVWLLSFLLLLVICCCCCCYCCCAFANAKLFCFSLFLFVMLTLLTVFAVALFTRVPLFELIVIVTGDTLRVFVVDAAAYCYCCFCCLLVVYLICVLFTLIFAALMFVFCKVCTCCLSYCFMCASWCTFVSFDIFFIVDEGASIVD